MGKSDIAAKEFMEDNDVFADVFNYLLYDGSPVIKADCLSSQDTVQSAMIAKNGEVLQLQKIRDVYKSCTLRTDGTTDYLLLGLEEQTDVSYIMPVRAMLYDALSYNRQAKAARRRHRRQQDYRGHSSGEYLSGFCREERLTPVITAVVFLSEKPWDGPTQLHDMLSIADPRLLPMIENYKLHLITPKALTKENLQKFNSSLREVLSFIKYSKDKEQLRVLVKGNPRFASLDKGAALVIRYCTHSDFKIDEQDKEERFNMCKALDDIRQEGFEDGQKIGLEIGLRGQVSMLKNLMESLGVTAAKAMDLLKITEPEQGKLMSMLNEGTDPRQK